MRVAAPCPARVPAEPDVFIQASSPARADDNVGDGIEQTHKGAFGLGLILGEPTGISARYYLGDQAIQAARSPLDGAHGRL